MERVLTVYEKTQIGISIFTGVVLVVALAMMSFARELDQKVTANTVAIENHTNIDNILLHEIRLVRESQEKTNELLTKHLIGEVNENTD